MPEPKFSTKRDPAYDTLGGRQSAFAKIWLGHELMPAQRLIADVAGELLPNGLPRYPLVVVTEPRQAGKSHLSMAQIGERCLSRRGFRAWYTAQTGSDARDQFVKFHEEVVKGQALEPMVQTLVGAGREVMRFPSTGSQLRPHPPTEEKLHGKQSDRNDIDEAWAFSEDEGRMLMQAIGPTQLTRPGAQTFIWSAGGTAASTWLASLVARGRAGDPGICYFEWGIPDDADPNDLDVIAAHHPAHGYTVTRDSLRSLKTLFEGDPAGWARAAGNRWTEVIGGAINATHWERSRALDPIPADAPIGFGAARAADGSEVAIVAAAEVAGRIVVEVVAIIPDVYNAAEHVAAAIGDNTLAVDRVGPSASLADALETAGVPLLPMTSGNVVAATAKVLDALKVTEPPIRYRNHPALDAAVKVAGTRLLGDGGKVWARVASGRSIAALEAATLAIWSLGHRAPDVGEPIIFWKAAA